MFFLFGLVQDRYPGTGFTPERAGLALFFHLQEFSDQQLAVATGVDLAFKKS